MLSLFFVLVPGSFRIVCLVVNGKVKTIVQIMIGQQKQIPNLPYLMIGIYTYK
jgi:hypothetical protein